MYSKFLLFFIIIFFNSGNQQNQKILDDFESLSGWKNITSDPSVTIKTQIVPGKSNNALRMDFNFSKGTGFCGIQKKLPLELPDNFQFSFYFKGNAPINNFEFKLVDESGDNVWWLNQRNYEFHNEWQKIIIKKRNIQFAWGPTKDKSLKKTDKIQFFLASATGGSGSIFIDDFKFEELAVPDTTPPKPVAKVSSEEAGFVANHIFDNDLKSQWRNNKIDSNPEIVIDLQKHYEYGGLVIDWDEKEFAKAYEILISHDEQNWETVYQVMHGKSGRAYIPLKDFESRYIKVKLLKSNNHIYAVNEIQVKDFIFSETPENLYKEICKDNPRGFYPRYLNNEQSYWTITGVNNDRDEALINEDGMVEVDKGLFSIEPFIFKNETDKFITWNDVEKTQHLEDNYLPIPSVVWERDDLQLESKIFADGPAGESALYMIYTTANTSRKKISGNLYLAIRPFQVNPPWQFLNGPGGTSKIESIEKSADKIVVNKSKTIFMLNNPDGFGAAEFDEGNIIDFISNDKLPARQSVKDKSAFASAALKYGFSLKPGEKKQVVLAIPFHESSKYVVPENEVSGRLSSVQKFWKEKINTVQFNLPKSANRLINTLRSNLAYILINRDGYGIQPGSRSYERSWIRDGSLTSSALLKLGVQREVKDFINWYAGYQYPNGAVPCVVDKRGPDPVPEHDSHGQLIFALMQYYLFTGDKNFLEEHFDNVKNAVNHMNELTSLCKTDVYKSGNATQKACYGLLPESISHEGYSAKPMHSYWDDFFGLKGYKDAVQIAIILGKNEDAKNFATARDKFHNNLYKSIVSAVKNKNIDFIPGCVELGDFDATSTAIAVYPCNELKNLPQPFAQNTFDRYYKYFTDRRDDTINWHDYTPYEVRLIGTFIYLGQVQKAHELIDFFFKDQRPPAWNHWAEVVRKGYRTAGFIGDMPHTWVGSDFISSLRSMFVYEDELNQSLVIGKGLYRDWIETPEGISVRNLPTYYGNLNYEVKKVGSEYVIELNGTIKLSMGNIILTNWWGKGPTTVIVNDKKISEFDTDKIIIKEFPATIHIIF